MAQRLAGILALITLGGLACAQTPDLLPAPRAVATAPQLPVLADSSLEAALADLQPASLPPPTQPRQDLPGPYFQPDPLLDPGELPPPGWFGALEATLLVPHIRYWGNITGPVFLPGGVTDMVSVTGAHLDPTVSPRLQFGYRLPAGFGEFLVGYRGFATQGSQNVPGIDGPSNVHSRLDMNMADIDYASHELSLLPWMDMRWQFGGRFVNVYMDSLQSTAPALAAAGTGVTDRHVTNRFYGFGPHFGFDLACFLYKRELSLVGRVDGSSPFGRIRQSFSETTLAVGPDGLPVGATNQASSSQVTPILNVQVGGRWQPLPYVDLFAGYQYEHWWNVGRLGVLNTNGEMYNHGLVLRASFCF